MSNGAEITGVDETVAALEQLGKSLTNDVEPAGKVAALGAAGAASIAPVISGALAASYTVQERFVVNDMPYSSFVEFGTSNMVGQYPVQKSLDMLSDDAVKAYTDWVMQQAVGAGFDTTG